jgi:quercetin dioxygenase-like cupin family protein
VFLVNSKRPVSDTGGKGAAFTRAAIRAPAASESYGAGVDFPAGSGCGTSGTNGDGVDYMNEDFARFDLEAEIRDSESRKPWPSAKHSKTLVNKDDLRLVLFTMESGATIKEHHADGSITVQVLRGEIRFRAQEQDHSLQAGQMLTLGRTIRHAVESIGDSAFLLTISRPGT